MALHPLFPVRVGAALPLLLIACGLIDPIDPAPGGATAAGGGGKQGILPISSGGTVTSGGQPSTGGSTPTSSGGSLGGSGTRQGGSSSQNTGGSTGGGTGGAVAGGSGGGSCVTNRDCGQLERCLPSLPSHRCVSLVSGVCPEVLGEEYAKDPGAIFVGAFAPLDGNNLGAKTIRTIYEMVINDFNGPVGGLRGADNAPPNPLVLVLCNNDNVIRNVVPDALKHLIDGVGVPAVLAAMDIDQLRAGVVEYNGTFFVSALGGSTEFASISKAQAWTMLGLPSDYADIYTALMPHIEAYVRRSLEMRPIRVAAVIEEGNAFQKELSDAVLARLTFNDQTLLANLDAVPPTFASYRVTGNGSNFETVRDALYSFQPDVLFSFASDTFTATNGGIMTELNLKYSAGERPFYVLSPENQIAGPNVTAEINRLKKIDMKDHAGRVIGVGTAQVPSEDKAALGGFTRRLKLAMPDALPEFANYYDALYFLIYALYASGPRVALLEGTVRAADMAKGMRRLIDLSPPAIEIYDISNVFDRLDANVKIQLLGALGAPDFDSDTGMRRESGSVYCFDSVRAEMQSDVIRFDRAKNQLIQEAVPRCLFNFLGPQ